MDWRGFKTNFHTNNTRGSVPVYGNVFRTRTPKSHDYSKNNRGYKRNRHYKYLLAVIATLSCSPVSAETVGGVSATASPVANSSGSVTNQAIQVLQGPYITNTYGGGIQCQGPTRNFTPYVTGTASASKPWEPYYMDPVYDISDNSGAFDEDDNPIGDGIIDNPGRILFHKKTRTGQKDNYSLGLGFSMTWSTPTDKNLQDLCKKAATTQIELNQQLAANKRLDFEIARLKNCGQLLKEGIRFAPGTRYAKVCEDVQVSGVNFMVPHVHKIPSTSSSSPSQREALQSLDSDPSALLGAPLQTRSSFVSP